VTPINPKARSHMNTQSDDIVDNPDSWVAEHIRDYVATDGRRGHRLPGWKASTLLLVTRGRRSGLLRRTALAYAEHDGSYVVVASNGGAERHPAWYLNLTENPIAEVQVLGDRFTARAREAGADERPALWKLMTSIGPSLDDYQRASGREIPVVILERT
jgi:deazaflavin-dependent oxidoreductase (nitroreductase family)